MSSEFHPPFDADGGEVPPKSTAIANQPTKGELMAVDDAFFNAGRAVHSFKGTPMEIWRLKSLATGPQCFKSDDCVGQNINIQHYYVHRVEILNKDTGELNAAMRVVIINSAGDAFAFVSDGIFRSLSVLVDSLGPGPYSPPIAVKVVQTKTTGNRKMLSLVPAE